MPRVWIWIALAAVCLLGVGGWAAWRWRTVPQPALAPVLATPAPPAEAIVPAILRAKNLIAVPAPSGGVLRQILVEPGREVSEGEVLAQISNPELERDRDQAQEAALAARERVTRIEADLASQRLESFRANAEAATARSAFERLEKAYQRQRLLFAEGATPRLVFEKAEREWQAGQEDAATRAKLAEIAEQRLKSLQTDLDRARTAAGQKQQELESANTALAGADVRSPVSGLVVTVRLKAGDEVDPGLTDLFQIATDLTAMEAVANVEAALHERLKPGSPAEVILAEQPEGPLSGTVVAVEANQVIVGFRSENPAIRPGLTAQVRLKAVP